MEHVLRLSFVKNETNTNSLDNTFIIVDSCRFFKAAVPADALAVQTFSVVGSSVDSIICA
jgi:hypothetical protein